LGGTIRYHPTSARAAAWRGFIDIELADGRASDKWRVLRDSSDECYSFRLCRNLERAKVRVLDDNVAKLLAQFDSANVSARAVNLLGDQGRALPALGLFTPRDVSASVDAKTRRRAVPSC